MIELGLEAGFFVIFQETDVFSITKISVGCIAKVTQSCLQDDEVFKMDSFSQNGNFN